jgi:hypothetical protein
LSGVKLHPLSWNFSSCPPREIPFLFYYEFSRELEWIHTLVDFIRHGQAEEPTYWSPIPDFGWKEWPDWPYLRVRQAERQKRLAGLFTVGKEEPVIVDLPVTATITDYVRALEERWRVSERQRLFVPSPRRDRSALKARYQDQLRMLSVYRLSKYHRPKEVFERLKGEYREIVYTSPKNFSRTLRLFDRHLCAFHLRAQVNINAGLWFPPFGRHLIEPETTH